MKMIDNEEIYIDMLKLMLIGRYEQNEIDNEHIYIDTVILM